MWNPPLYGRPVMYLLRAGLFAIIIALCTSLTSAAPLPITNSLSSTLASSSRPSDLHHHSGSHTPRIIDSSGHVQHILATQNQQVLPSAEHSDGVASRNNGDLERRNIFSKIKHAFKKIGSGIKHAVKKIGHGIKSVAKKVGHGIKTAAKKVGHGIKTAAKKVGHFVKTTGAKIAKVGLKIWSTAQKIASKVAQFIPVIGKPISKALDGASALTNMASNKIHAKIGGKLGKAMKAMDKTRKIAGYIPRELPEDALEERELEELYSRYIYEDYNDVDIRDVYDGGLFYARQEDFDPGL